jgi:hypothetical protein
MSKAYRVNERLSLSTMSCTYWEQANKLLQTCCNCLALLSQGTHSFSPSLPSPLCRGIGERRMCSTYLELLKQHVIGDDSKVICFNATCVSHCLAQAAIHLQVASQGTGVVNVHNTDMAMSLLSTCTKYNLQALQICRYRCFEHGWQLSAVCKSHKGFVGYAHVTGCTLKSDNFDLNGYFACTILFGPKICTQIKISLILIMDFGSNTRSLGTL